MSYRLHYHSEAGRWCAGSYETEADARTDAKNIIKTRESKAGEKWKSATPTQGCVLAWVNTKGHRIDVEKT